MASKYYLRAGRWGILPYVLIASLSWVLAWRAPDSVDDDFQWVLPGILGFPGSLPFARFHESGGILAGMLLNALLIYFLVTLVLGRRD